MKKSRAKIIVKAECFATYKTSEDTTVKYYADCKESMVTNGPITEEELLKLADHMTFDWVYHVIQNERKGILIEGETPLPNTDLSLRELKTRNVCIELQETLTSSEDDDYFKYRGKRLCYSERLI